MNTQRLIHTTLALVLVAATASAGAQGAKKEAKKPAVKHETAAQLAAEAKVSKADATKSALALVPGGTVKSTELERENGKLVYSFDIATKGKSGIDEVQIDAISGAQVGKVEHESPKAEKAEEKAEAKEKKAAAKKP